MIRLLEKCQIKTDQKSLGNKTNRERRPGFQQRSKAKDECKKQVIAHIESLKGELSAKEAKDKYYQLIKRCEPKTRSRQPSWRTNGMGAFIYERYRNFDVNFNVNAIQLPDTFR